LTARVKDLGTNRGKKKRLSSESSPQKIEAMLGRKRAINKKKEIPETGGQRGAGSTPRYKHTKSKEGRVSGAVLGEKKRKGAA